eukprot:6178955-Pleurochrysis_carterae.AAC.1
MPSQPSSSHGTPSASSSRSQQPCADDGVSLLSSQRSATSPKVTSEMQQPVYLVCSSCKNCFKNDRGLATHLARTPSCGKSAQLRTQATLQRSRVDRATDQQSMTTASKSDLKYRELEYKGNIRALELDGLSSLRLHALVPDTILVRVKMVVASWMRAASAELNRRLEP